VASSFVAHDKRLSRGCITCWICCIEGLLDFKTMIEHAHPAIVSLQPISG
jgi:hypothetical protein